MSDIEKAVSQVDFDGVEAGDFSAFCQLMHVLRSENGCPWDRAQTLESLQPSITGELAEIMAGLTIYRTTGDARNLCEEMGDLMMNFVLMADLAQEQGMFSMEDILREAGRKMIRRHPHVFGEEARKGYGEGVLLDGEELPRTWDTIKAVEKRGIDPQQKAAEKAAVQGAKEQLIAILQDKTEG